ncbi:MAG: hypothetical protein NC253_00380 [Ruminococcus sp.]|nr:hypothetical protein [Ruminococcus sp.]MCM1381660.1 hypothetical protein [Muribaculaceae bacterium]MCM1480994.1 hypothetical protein [Muribaculaceae bacterium]
MINNPIIRKMSEEIVKICSPLQIFLATAKTNSKGELSRFKLCVVAADGYDVHSLETEILLKTDCPVPCDIIAYNISEWNECLDDDFSFAYRIENEGNLIYEQKQ